MSALMKVSTVVKGALLGSALLAVAGISALRAQDRPAQLQSVAAPAPAAPAVATAPVAPHASPLFERDDPNAPTLASARAAHEAAMSGGDNHTIVVSTLVLVLGVVILVLLIT